MEAEARRGTLVVSNKRRASVCSLRVVQAGGKKHHFTKVWPIINANEKYRMYPGSFLLYMAAEMVYRSIVNKR